MGLSLLDCRSGFPLHLRNLGANFVEYSLKSTFETLFSPAEQLQAKELLWSAAFAYPSALMPDEKPLIKDKMASALALLACRLWLRPETDIVQWNGFFDVDLMGVLTDPSSDGSLVLLRQELALLTVSRLIELVRAGTTNTSEESEQSSTFVLSEVRRVQLHSGLEIVLPGFFSWIFDNFPQAVKQAQTQTRVIEAAVACFHSACTWLHPMDINGISNFISSCFVLLNILPASEGLVLSILEALQLMFAQRAFTPSETVLIENMLSEQVLSQITVILQRFLSISDPDSDDFEANYQAAKLTVEIMCNLANRFVGHRKNPIVHPSGVSAYLNFLLQISHIPSLVVVMEIDDAWLSIIRSPAFMENHKKSVSTVLSSLLMQKMVHLAGVRSEHYQRPFNKIDFEDSSEFSHFWKLSHNRALDLIRTLASVFPNQCLQMTYNALGSFVQSGTIQQNPKQWEALLQAQEAVIKGVSRPDEATELLVNHLQLLQIHAPLPQTEALLNRWVDVVRQIVSGLGNSCPPPDFERSIQLLYSLATNSDAPLSVQNSAASALVRLADTNPTLFLPLLEGLLGAVSPHLSGNTASSQRKLFSELVLILMAQPSISLERQAELFASVADPLVNLLQNAKATLFSTSDPCRSLMLAVGCADLQNPKSSPEAKKCRSDLNTLIATLQILFKRVGPLPHGPAKEACSNVLDELVSFLMLMIQCTHRMYGKAAWEGLEAQYQIFKNELGQTEVENSSEGTSAARQVAGWTKNCRQTCYQTLSLATSHFSRQFFALPSIVDRFMSQALSYLDCLQLQDWSMLLKFLLLPTLTSCTEQHLMPQLAGGCLTGLLAVLVPQLNVYWEAVRAAVNSAAQGSALSAEIEREQIAISVTSTLFNFLSEVIFSTSKHDTTVSLAACLQTDELLPLLPFEYTAVGQWFINGATFELQHQLLSYILTSTSYPRSPGHYVKCLALVNYLVASILSRKDVPIEQRTLLLSQTITVGLSLLSEPSWNDFTTSTVALLTELYKWSFLSAAFVKYSAHQLFNDDAKTFLNQNTKLSFEFEERLLAVADNKQSVLGLRQSVLLAETLKSQRAAMRAILTTNFKTKIELSSKSHSKESAERDLASKLTEMKKRLVTSKPIFDDLDLSDIFN